MLHPELGTPLDPLATWQVDTDEMATVASLYNRQVGGVDKPEKISRLVGKLWKKLSASPRLARLLIDYARFEREGLALAEAGPHDGPGFFGRIFASVGRSPSREVSPPRLVFSEDDPLYDRWVDGAP